MDVTIKFSKHPVLYYRAVALNAWRKEWNRVSKQGLHGTGSHAT